ncbi:MAG: Rab family GTPase [Promethearchaeota archaeon]
MPEWVLKLCLLGDGAVGKTSLVYRFIEGRFSTDFKTTLGVNLLKKRVSFPETNTNANVNIWDLGGQKAYRRLRNLYLEGSNGALLVYDVTNPTSFENLDDWLGSFKAMRGDRPTLVIGNKIDLPRRVTRETAEEYAQKYDNVKYLETSAKTGENVEEAFKGLIKKVIEYEKAK